MHAGIDDKKRDWFLSFFVWSCEYSRRI